MSSVQRALATFAGLVAAIALTVVVFRLPLMESLSLMASGAVGDSYALSRTVVKSIPLIICGLAMTIAWRAGIYNIGGEGQFLIGGLCGASIADRMPGVYPPALNLLIFLSCCAGGAAWAWLAGWLEVRRGVQAVVSTILLNFVALQMLDYFVSGPLMDRASGVPLTKPLAREVMLHRYSAASDLHAGVYVAILAVIGVGIFLGATKAGFQLRVAGSNPDAARAARMNVGRIRLRAMALSGALCGLAAAIEYTAITGQIGTGFSQQIGFLGIPVALLGGLSAMGTMLSGLFFGALFSGSENLARFTTSGSTIVYVIQALTLFGYIFATQSAKFARQSKVAAP